MAELRRTKSEEHAEVMHGINTAGLTDAQIAVMRDRDHDTYGAGHPEAMRAANRLSMLSQNDSLHESHCNPMTIRGLLIRTTCFAIVAAIFRKRRCYSGLSFPLAGCWLKL